ncbi:MAG TPA: RagB/SusD family nutrient uptake outer membrane protein [Niastella sp.]
MSGKRSLIFYIRTTLFLLSMVMLFSCKKYLDKKPSQSLTIPSTLADLQAILDNVGLNGKSPGYAELVADNYYLTSASYNQANISERTSYVWDKDAMPLYIYVWNPVYEGVYNANFVLDYLPKVSKAATEQNVYDKLKGGALFFRSFYFHQLAQLFCKPYTSSAATDPGIVLRLSSGVASKSERATVQQTYDQIINDLKAAAELLPQSDIFTTRPNKAAAYAELARVYLTMRDYNNAKFYAEAALAINNNLLDYNSYTSSNLLPAFVNNTEILFVSFATSPDELRSPKGIIDTSLYLSYSTNDLRKSIFFETNSSGSFWKGSYFPEAGTYKIFDGLAIDEVYLILAECQARTNSKDAAMSTLNSLLRKRWKTGTYTDLTAADANDAINKILTERRKELLFRGLRWSDLRRLNVEGANITLRRIVNGNTYSLPPDDLRWVLLIPDLETGRSGIQQNAR